MGPRSKTEALLRLDIPYIVPEEKHRRQMAQAFGDRRTKFPPPQVLYFQGNKKEGHHLRVSRVGRSVRDLRTEKL